MGFFSPTTFAGTSHDFVHMYACIYMMYICVYMCVVVYDASSIHVHLAVVAIYLYLYVPTPRS
jgi:hypothetical protein